MVLNTEDIDDYEDFFENNDFFQKNNPLTNPFRFSNHKFNQLSHSNKPSISDIFEITHKNKAKRMKKILDKKFTEMLATRKCYCGMIACVCY